MSVSVFLCVCPRAYLSNVTSKLHQLSYACYLWPLLDPPSGVRIRYVLQVLKFVCPPIVGHAMTTEVFRVTR